MTKMMDECFRARMNVLTGRFPLQEFREAFVKEMAEHGMVLIQGAAFCTSRLMETVENSGIVFNSKHNAHIAMYLARRWGFDVEPIDRGELTGCRVTFPQDYLRQHIGSDQLGRMRTRDRNALHRETPEAKEHMEGQRFVI